MAGSPTPKAIPEAASALGFTPVVALRHSSFDDVNEDFYNWISFDLSKHPSYNPNLFRRPPN